MWSRLTGKLELPPQICGPSLAPVNNTAALEQTNSKVKIGQSKQKLSRCGESGVMCYIDIEGGSKTRYTQTRII